MKITKKKINRYDYGVYLDDRAIGSASKQENCWEALTVTHDYKEFKTLKECVEYISSSYLRSLT